MRESTDAVERIGVEISASYVSKAVVVLACADGESTIVAIADALRSINSAPVIGVRTKSDLSPPTGAELVAFRDVVDAVSVVPVSAESGDGLADLVAAIGAVVASVAGERDVDAPVLTQERHRYAVARALDEIRLFREVWQERLVPAPVAAVHLRAAVTSLEDLIGGVDVDQILDEVFRRFCVGK
jgi:tRNA modification GTPase